MTSNTVSNTTALPVGREIPHKFWEAIREDYVKGEGTLEQLAKVHGLNIWTVQKKSQKGKWSELRRRRAEAALHQLIPPGPLELQPPSIPSTVEIDEKWLREQ